MKFIWLSIDWACVNHGNDCSGTRTLAALLCTFHFFEGFVCSLDTPQKTVCPDWSLCHFCALLPPLFKVISDAKIHEFFVGGGPAWLVESAGCAR